MSDTTSPATPANPITVLGNEASNLVIPPDFLQNLLTAMSQLVSPAAISSLEALLFMQMVFMAVITTCVLVAVIMYFLPEGSFGKRKYGARGGRG